MGVGCGGAAGGSCGIGVWGRMSPPPPCRIYRRRWRLPYSKRCPPKYPRPPQTSGPRWWRRFKPPWQRRQQQRPFLHRRQRPCPPQHLRRRPSAINGANAYVPTSDVRQPSPDQYPNAYAGHSIIANNLLPTPDLATMVEQVQSGVVRIDTTDVTGTGLIFETASDGSAYVLTNYHVIEGASQIRVRVNDLEQYTATLLGYDAIRDLAVLEICCARFNPVPFTDATEVRPGSEVFAIGYSLGLSGTATVTRGIVSAQRYDPDYAAWVIQTDAPINPGNSGGPLLTRSGHAIGINTFAFSVTPTGKPVEGVGFAISERTIRGMLGKLEALARCWPFPRRYRYQPLPLHLHLLPSGGEPTPTTPTTTVLKCR